MGKKLHVAASPLTGTIFVGRVLREGIWAEGKQDLTLEAIVAVAEHGLHFGRPIEVSKADGTPLYMITVERVQSEQE